jgi:hypothetical protein
VMRPLDRPGLESVRRTEIPISEELLARYAKRTRTARAFMMAFFFAWAVAIVVAILAGSAAHSGSLSAIAAWLFLLGLPLFIGAVVVLAKRTSTIPLRWRVLVAEDGRQYLRIENPSPAFADALRGRGLSSSTAPRPQLRRARAFWLLVASAVLPLVLTVLFLTGHVAVAAGVLIGYAFLAMVGSVVSGIVIGTRRGGPPQAK